MGSISKDAIDFARTTLQALQDIELPAERWREVETQLQNLQHALEQDDAHAFRQARKALEELSRPRVGRIGKDRQTLLQPPKPIRDHINHLVEKLQPQGNPPAQQAQSEQKNEGR